MLENLLRAFYHWPVVFAKTKTRTKVKPMCNLIRTFSVFRKYIGQYHWKWYDTINAFQHLQLSKQLSSPSTLRIFIALLFIPSFTWISNALPKLLLILVLCKNDTSITTSTYWRTYQAMHSNTLNFNPVKGSFTLWQKCVYS